MISIAKYKKVKNENHEIIEVKTRNPNGAGSIIKRTDGRYCAKIQIGTDSNDKPIIKYLYGKTESDAQDKLDKYKLMLATQDTKNNPYAEMNFDEYILRWLKDVKVNELKPASYDTLERTIINHVIPTLGHYKITEISSQIIQQEAILQAQRNKLSYSTIKKIYNAIKACYSYAIGDGHISINPTINVVLPSEHKFDTKEIRILTDEEIEIFKATATSKTAKGSYRYPLGYGFIFMLNTGIRIGEALAVQWKDINFDKCKMIINKNAIEARDREEETDDIKKYKTIVQKSAKTKSGNRVVPLNKAAIESLEKLKEIRYFGEDSNVFSTENDTMFIRKNLYDMFNRIYEKGMTDDAIEKAIKRASLRGKKLSKTEIAEVKKKAKTDTEKVGVHALRHTFASKLFENNVNVKVISEILGHANISITYDTYVHIIESMKEAAVMSIDSI